MTKLFKILFLFLFLVTGVSHSGQAQIRTITYEITAGNLSLEAIGAYPQKLIRHQREDTLHRVIVSTFAAYDDTVKRKIVENDRYVKNKAYPQNIKVYLEPTPLTNYNCPEIKNVADSILNSGDSLTVQIIMRSLEYASKRIKFDNKLALELDKGNCTTLPVEAVLERGEGTCSEYTNLFIALVRRLGIPCRMAVGYIYMPEQNFQGSHAWAECYIEHYGWLGVEPQNAFIWLPPVVIKLFYGRDFRDCNIKTLPDMYPVNVKIWNGEDKICTFLSAPDR